MRLPLPGILLLLLLRAAAPAGPEPTPVETTVFRAGEDGYHTFRIPALMLTKKGTLLAFAEGRRNSRSDTGDIDLVLKRSFDAGKSWTKLMVIADHGADTIGNPTVVVDRKTGTIRLLLTRLPSTISGGTSWKR